MAGLPKKRLGEMLLDAGVIDQFTLDHALELQKKSGRKLGTVLMQEGLIDEQILLNFLKKQLGVEVIAGADLEIDDQAWHKVPAEIIKKYTILPIKLEGNQLTIAMSDPLNVVAIDDLRFATGCQRIKVVLAAEKTIENIIVDRLHTKGLVYDIIDHGELYRRAMEMIDKDLAADLLSSEPQEEKVSTYDIKMESESPPIISIVNYIFFDAFKKKASDIHIEPYQTFFRIRFRIDGILYTVLTPPQRLATHIISRIKIMSDMDISKRMIPQDGHLALKMQEERIHFRVSTLPTVYGEKVVLRILRKQKNLDDLAALGFAPDILERYGKVIRAPQGMVLFTGPTGSGKTTTLYASLNFVNAPTTNIVTLEDPVESTLYGINHVQIRHNYGLEFADGLRSILRQDPDIIFVGEIRDSEVAEIALKASMTGHMVFSTLHTNSTAETFERLLDMDVEPYLISNTVLAVVAQRLLRRICNHCKEPYVPTPEVLADFGLDESFLQGVNLYMGKGCSQCMETGYQGRIAAYEVFFMTNSLRALVKAREGAAVVRQKAIDEGMQPMIVDGLEKVRMGITTLDEVRRVLITENW